LLKDKVKFHLCAAAAPSSHLLLDSVPKWGHIRRRRRRRRRAAGCTTPYQTIKSHTHSPFPDFDLGLSIFGPFSTGRAKESRRNLRRISISDKRLPLLPTQNE
jgi:hypothetical protein